MVGRELRLDLAACGLGLQACGVHLCAGGARRRDRPTDPRDRLATAQQPADDVGLLHVPAGRMKVDRTLGVLDAGQEAANALACVPIDLALDGDPAVAARPARVRCPLGKIDRQPMRKSGIFGRRFLGMQRAWKQHGHEKQNTGKHVTTGPRAVRIDVDVT